MPRRYVALVPDEYYHVYNRGCNCQAIFCDAENYLFFLRRLRKYLLPSLDVIAYCLMPTHYHLLVHVHSADTSQALQRFSISYTKAFNRQNGRVGALFQGAFKAKWVTKNAYLIHLSRYIHMNPVTAGLVTKPEDWVFSSFREYAGLRRGTMPRPAVVLSQFPSIAAYVDFVAEYREDDVDVIMELTLD